MNNKGFTYSSILINLLIAGFVLPIVVSSLKLLTNIDFVKNNLQNEIGIIQLRRDLLCGYDFNVELNQLSFNYKNEENVLKFNNGHLYRTPGTVIYLEGIQHAVFDERDSHIYLIYYESDREYERIVY